MKISNIIILTVIALFFIGAVGNNIILKKEFNKIDKADPSYGFSTEPVKPFKYVRLQGNGFALTEIRQGPKPQFRTIAEAKYLEWKVANDTLTVTYKADWNQANALGDVDGKPSIYIIAPQISAISSDKIRFRVRDFNFENLSVDQKGLQTAFSNTTAKNLNVKVSSGGYLKMDEKNRFGPTSIEVADSSSLELNKNVFASLKTRIDSAARVMIPGNLVKTLAEK